jgi:CubicO group peptidase (beta-lactamase class C family)
MRKRLRRADGQVRRLCPAPVRLVAPASHDGVVLDEGRGGGGRGDRGGCPAASVLPYQVEPASELTSLMDRFRIPAVSVAVVAGGRVDWARGWGVRDARVGDPVTPRTLFQAGSISKPIAATCALRLVGEDRLGLEADVNDYGSCARSTGSRRASRRSSCAESRPARGRALRAGTSPTRAAAADPTRCARRGRRTRRGCPSSSRSAPAA